MSEITIESLTTERDNLIKERDVLSTERDNLIKERDVLSTERDNLIKERDALTAERNELKNLYEEKFGKGETDPDNELEKEVRDHFKKIF